MVKMLLKIENLSVKTREKEVLRNISLEIKKGEVHALLGPNASGKFTLTFSIMGFPEYEITHGKILFEGKDVTHLPIEEKAKLGITLAFQNPSAIKGVKLSHLLKTISKQPLDINYFPPDNNLLEKEINVGFSGGEKKALRNNADTQFKS